MRIPHDSSNVFHIGLVGLVVMALAGLLGVDQAVADNAPPVAKAEIQEAYGKLPLSFEANRGQTDSRVKFLNRGKGYALFLTPTEAVLALRQEAKPEQRVLRLRLLDANSAPSLVGVEELPGKVNYFIGQDREKWRTNIPTYAKVTHKNVYPGIDLAYYGNQGQLEFDFIVAPGANPNAIRLAVEGADRLAVDAQGDLVLYVRDGRLRLQKPVVYQAVKGIKQEVSGGYVLTNAHQVGFQVAAYDASRPLIIDPVLFYSTYLGGSGDDLGGNIAVDASGNAYLTGETSSTNFPTTTGAFQSFNSGGQDVFVTKLNPTGSGLVYSTYLGGNGPDVGMGIAVDAVGNAYVAGQTFSANFPTTPGAFQTAFGGVRDAFVTKLNPTGSTLIYSTYLGGSGGDFGVDIAVDAAGNAYVAGGTASSNFPTTPGAFQTAFAGGGFFGDAFVTKLNPTGSGLVYSTYLGGNGQDGGGGIAVDAVGNAYVTGFTDSTNFPTTLGVFQTAFGGGFADAFVTKLDPTGSTLVYSTYLGGSDGDDGRLAVAVDAAGNAYVTGLTLSTNFPTTPGAFQPAFGGGCCDAFVTKLDPTGSTLVYSTYLGGSDDDEGFSIALDVLPNPNAYVTGFTSSNNFPTTPNAFQAVFGGGFEDAFVTKVNPTGSGLVYSTYLGGNGDDEGLGIAVDALPNPNAYVTGFTSSSNFPTTPGAFQPAFGGGPDDGFVAKITEAAVPPGQAKERVTGGGTIDVVGGIGSFSFIVQRQASTGELGGHLQYFNHASGAQVRSDTITSHTIVGNTATFGGTCTVNGAPCTFTVNVMDNGEPGTTDTFTISVDGGLPEGDTLRSGNILITQ